MDHKIFNQDFFSFIQKSPTSFHAVKTISEELINNGCEELLESVKWQLQANKSYFVIRNHGSIICFNTGEQYNPDYCGSVRFLGSHTDSPSLQIKPNPLINSSGYETLGVEVYGGPILSSWFDRDLGIAGRISWLDSSDLIQTSLFDSKAASVIVPSLAIHLDREKNKGVEINNQQHLPPLFSMINGNNQSDFNLWLKEVHEPSEEKNISEILAYDLFCYDRQPPAYIGKNKDFFSCPRLDNLMSCFAGVRAFLDSRESGKATFLILNDHEEVGSASRSGADGSFVSDVFSRIFPNKENQLIIKNKSYLISMDNAHAVHPNYSERSDKNHQVLLNKGITIKINSKLRYATDSVTNSIFKKLCKESDVPYQEFVMRSDMPCGSTIGPITSSSLGLKTIDVGIPTLGMHSIRELGGKEDPYSLYKLAKHFLCKESF